MEKMFTQKKRESAVDIVINTFKELLLEKKLVAGDRIPSEMDLARELGVSRGSVREAIKILSAFGIVDVRVGDGTYIASETKSRLIDPVLFSLLISAPNVRELTEFRRFLEIDIIEMIILHSDSNQETIRQLEQNVAELGAMQNEAKDLEKLGRNDIEFHRIFAKASNNIIMEKIYNFVLDYFEPSIMRTLEKQVHGATTFEVHQQILEAILDRDIEKGIEAVNCSVEAWEELRN